MGLVLLGAGIMLVGVMMGYALGTPKTEEVVKWTQDINEIK